MGLKGWLGVSGVIKVALAWLNPGELLRKRRNRYCTHSGFCHHLRQLRGYSMLLSQLSADAPEKAEMTVPATRLWDADGARGLWLCPGPGHWMRRCQKLPIPSSHYLFIFLRISSTPLPFFPTSQYVFNEEKELLMSLSFAVWFAEHCRGSASEEGISISQTEAPYPAELWIYGILSQNKPFLYRGDLLSKFHCSKKKKWLIHRYNNPLYTWGVVFVEVTHLSVVSQEVFCPVIFQGTYIHHMYLFCAWHIFKWMRNTSRCLQLSFL